MRFRLNTLNREAESSSALPQCANALSNLPAKTQSDLRQSPKEWTGNMGSKSLQVAVFGSQAAGRVGRLLVSIDSVNRYALIQFVHQGAGPPCVIRIGEVRFQLRGNRPRL